MSTTTPRTIRLRVRPPDRPKTANGLANTRLIGDVHYLGGEEADVEQLEALELLAAGHCELCPDERLTGQEAGFLAAISDPMWAPRHGRYPKFEEFA